MQSLYLPLPPLRQNYRIGVLGTVRPWKIIWRAHTKGIIDDDDYDCVGLDFVASTTFYLLFGSSIQINQITAPFRRTFPSLDSISLPLSAHISSSIFANLSIFPRFSLQTATPPPALHLHGLHAFPESFWFPHISSRISLPSLQLHTANSPQHRQKNYLSIWSSEY